MMERRDELIVEEDLVSIIKSYLDAFAKRDLLRCLDFFAEDATIDFALGAYQSKEDIQEWHEDRFSADLKVLSIDEIKEQGESVTVNVVITSKVARQWKFNSVSGKAVFIFELGKIKEANFGLRMAIPFEGW